MRCQGCHARARAPRPLFAAAGGGGGGKGVQAAPRAIPARPGEPLGRICATRQAGRGLGGWGAGFTHPHSPQARPGLPCSAASPARRPPWWWRAPDPTRPPLVGSRNNSGSWKDRDGAGGPGSGRVWSLAAGCSALAPCRMVSPKLCSRGFAWGTLHCPLRPAQRSSSSSRGNCSDRDPSQRVAPPARSAAGGRG